MSTMSNVLCTVFCGRGCVSLESEKGKKKVCEQWDGTMGTSGVLRGPRGPKNFHFVRKSMFLCESYDFGKKKKKQCSPNCFLPDCRRFWNW